MSSSCLSFKTCVEVYARIGFCRWTQPCVRCELDHGREPLSMRCDTYVQWQTCHYIVVQLAVPQPVIGSHSWMVLSITLHLVKSRRTLRSMLMNIPAVASEQGDYQADNMYQQPDVTITWTWLN